jgi:hypothetical protein
MHSFLRFLELTTSWPRSESEPRGSVECSHEAGALDEDAQAADLLQEYEAKIAALEPWLADKRSKLGS